jgi:CO/xanthine dehydrogenase Mo-binding subunit
VPFETAARQCLQQILAAAGPMLNNAPAAELEIRDSLIRLKSDPSKQVRLSEVMQRRGRSVTGDGATAAVQNGMDVERTSGAHFVEVEVDRETGKVHILKYISAHDVGRPINVTIVENQIEGGTIQGLRSRRPKSCDSTSAPAAA